MLKVSQWASSIESARFGSICTSRHFSTVVWIVDENSRKTELQPFAKRLAVIGSVFFRVNRRERDLRLKTALSVSFYAP
jgi:hypothetical protein